jgi:hypothetical protein
MKLRFCLWRAFSVAMPLPRTVVLGARNLRQNAIRLDGQNLHLTTAMISLTANEHRIARTVSQRIDTEARLSFGFHVRVAANGWVTARSWVQI